MHNDRCDGKYLNILKKLKNWTGAACRCKISLICAVIYVSLFVMQYKCHYLWCNTRGTICDAIQVSLLVMQLQVSLFVVQYKCHYLWCNTSVTICGAIQVSLFVMQYKCHYLWCNPRVTICDAIQVSLFVMQLQVSLKVNKGKVFCVQEPACGEWTTKECGVNYELLAVMLLKQPNGELPVAVDHSQLQIMSEAVDPIYWPLPPTLHKAVSPELPVLHDANAVHKLQDLLQRVRREHATFGMPGQRTALPVRQLRVKIVSLFVMQLHVSLFVLQLQVSLFVMQLQVSLVVMQLQVSLVVMEYKCHCLWCNYKYH